MENNTEHPQTFGQHHGENSGQPNNHHVGMGHMNQHIQTPSTMPVPPAQPVYDTSSYGEPAAWIPSSGPKWRGLFKSAAYLPEYVVMLILLLSLVGAVVALVGIGIDSLIKTEEATSDSSYASLYGGGISAFQLIWSLSVLIVSLPTFAWLFVRTRQAESEAPKVKQHRWRKAFLGIFLVIEGLTAVWTLGVLVFDLLGRAIGGDNELFSYFASGGQDPWWQGVIVTILSIAVLVFTIFVMSRDYRSKEEA